MFTKETVCKEIREFAEGPVTPERTKLLACLLYIKERCHDLPGGEKTEDAVVTDFQLCEWVDHMKNADGTVGGNWTREEAEVIQGQYGIACNATDFYVALNMMYSDYCTAAVQSGVSTVMLYARMAEAFLKDPDARPGKLKRYYEYVAQHE